MQAIRYSKGFKMQCVREVEAGKSCAYAVQRKYKIKGTATVMRWVRQLGSGRYGKIIRVEQAQEVNEAGQLRSERRWRSMRTGAGRARISSSARRSLRS